MLTNREKKLTYDESIVVALFAINLFTVVCWIKGLLKTVKKQ